MRLTPPKKNVFWLTVILAAVAAVAYVVTFFVELPAFVAICAVALLAVSYILLVLSIALKGF